MAGTASNVVALKTTAAAPMSVIERMFHLFVVPANNNPDRPQFLKFLKLKIEIYFGVRERELSRFSCPVYSHLSASAMARIKSRVRALNRSEEIFARRYMF